MRIRVKHLLSFIFVALFIVLVAACTPSAPEEFTVEFNSVGGSAVESQVVEAGGKVDEPTAPTRTDYIFDGWYKEFALTNEWDFDTDTVDDNMTLYAKWEAAPAPVYYTVEFVGNGGAAPEDMMLLANSLITGISDPVRGGFVFTGWFKEEALTNEWNFATDRVNANTVLYAGWDEVAISYNFVFNSNGGSEVATQSVAAGAKATVPMNPTKSGYVFVGWFTTSALTTQWNFDTMLVNGHKTVYAKWLEEVTVTFDAGAGDVLPESVTVGMGMKISEPVALLTGFEFQGWFTDQEFTDEFDFDVDVVLSDMTLYAKWWEIPEGTAIYSQDELYDLLSGQTTYEAGAHFYLRNDLDFTDFEWDGALFAEATLAPHSFNLNGNGKTISNITFTGTNQAGLIPRMSGGSVYDLTLNNIHVTGAAQGGILIGRIMNESTVDIYNVAVMNSSVTGGAAGVGGLIGHIQGAAGKSTVSISNLVMTGITVTNVNNSTGGVVGDIESSKLTLQDVLVEAVVTTTGERVGGLVGEARRNSGNVNDLPELFVDNAVVKAELFGLRYLAGVVGRADNNMTNLDAGIHGAASLPLPGTISDVVLILNLDLTHASDTNSGHIARSNVNAPTNAYVIAFNYDRANLNGINVPVQNVYADIESIPASIFAGFSEEWGTAVAGQLPSLNDLSINAGHKVTLHLGELTQVQYVRDGRPLSPIYVADQAGLPFDQFYMEATFDTPYANALINGNTELYGKFSPLYSVTFDSKLGSSVESQTIKEGLTATQPANPTRDLYSFDGWYLDEAYSGTTFDFATPVMSDLVLYAKWIDNVSPVIEFETEAGDYILSMGGSLVVEFTIVDASALDVITFNIVSTEQSFGLVAAESSIELPDAPYVDATTKSNFELLGVIAYDELSNVFTVTFTPAATSDFVANSIPLTLSVGAEDVLDNIAPSVNLILNLNVVSTQHTVSFDMDGGDEIADVLVYEGMTVELPENPTKSGFVFVGWYANSERTTPFDPETLIMTDTIIYAKWTDYVPTGTAITTTQEFFDLTIGANGMDMTGNYYLANDLDFTEFVWTVDGTNQAFTGNLDGNFKSISNLTIDYTGITSSKAGIFNVISNGGVKNITFVDVTVISTNRAGIIAGEATGSNLVTLENIVIIGGSLTGNADNGVGGLLGMGQTNLAISNIYVEGLSLTNTSADNAGAIIGQIDGGSASPTETITMNDIFVKNITVNTVDRAGAIYGENKNGMIVNISRVVVIGAQITNTAGYAGGIGGRHQSTGGATTITDAYINATISTTTNASSITGGNSVTAVNTFAVEVSITGTTSGTQANTAITDDSIIDEAWWTINLPTIAESDLWTYDAMLHVYVLVNGLA